MANLDELLAQADQELGTQVIPTATPTPQAVVTTTPSSGFGELASAYGAGLKQGILDLPGNLYDIATTGLKYLNPIGPTLSLIETKRDIEQSGLSPLAYALQKAETGLETVGRGASQIAGGAAGSILGPVGMAAGAGLGDVAFTSLVDLLTGEQQTPLIEKAYQAGYGAGGAVAGEGLARAVPPAIVKGKELAGTKIKEALGPQTQQAALAELGKQELIKQAYPETILAERLKEIKKEPIQVQTSAELYPTGAGAMIEKAIAANPEFQVKFGDLRGKAETKGPNFLLEQIRPNEKLIEAPETLGAYELGALKKEALTKADEALQTKLEQLYAPIDTKYTITKWGSAKSNITKAIEKYGGGERYITGDFRTLIDDIRESKEFKVGQLQTLRSKALRFEREFRDTGDRGLAAVAGTVGEQLKNIIEKTPTGAKDWKAANAAAAPLLKLRNEGPLGNILLNRKLTNEQLLSKVTANKSSVKQYKDLIEDDPAGIAALQTHFINEIQPKTPADRAAYIRQKKGALQEAFGKDFETLDAMQQQQKRYAELARLGTPLRGSQTAPLAELSPKIAELVTGKAPQSAAQIAAGSLGKGLAGALIGHTIFPGGLGEVVGYEIGRRLQTPFERSQKLQRQALYDIATNPFKAIEAQQLAKALAAKESAPITPQVTTEGLRSLLTAARASGGLSAEQAPAARMSDEQQLLSNIDALFGDSTPTQTAPTQVKPLATPTPISAKIVRDSDSGTVSEPINQQSLTLNTLPTNPKRSDYESLIEKTALKYGVPPEFAKAVAASESAFNPKAKSNKGAIGIFQLMPGTAKDLGVDPTDPVQNIDGGIRYLAQQLKTFDNDQQLAAAAFNWGPARVQKAVKKTNKEGVAPTWDNILNVSWTPSETQKYVSKVITKRNEYSNNTVAENDIVRTTTDKNLLKYDDYDLAKIADAVGQSKLDKVLAKYGSKQKFTVGDIVNALSLDPQELGVNINSVLGKA